MNDPLARGDGPPADEFVEFPCHECGLRLRLSPAAVGSPVKCPACGSIQDVPAR